MSHEDRLILLVSRSRIDEAARDIRSAAAQLLAHGLVPVITAEASADAVQLGGTEAAFGLGEGSFRELDKDCKQGDIELVLVLGGDGSILKAAELVRESNIPLLGINLGHVGFLAEGEKHEMDAVLGHIAAREYTVQERMALDVTVLENGRKVYSTWALNEATVEKSARERMLEVVLEVEEHPLSSFGCDGVVVATPTGSTAYAFSAGGPVVWPNVEAILMVPLSAHALFARPLVVNPEALLAVEVLRRSAGSGVLWCDGRRTFELAPGSRVEVRKSAQGVKIVRLDNSSFTNRLVNKFSLPVAGWRGPEA
ncbi:MAG: hypothetical protein RLZ88_1002 [Actinomycetota bacterium]|mgnify:CR=1 FL=1